MIIDVLFGAFLAFIANNKNKTELKNKTQIMLQRISALKKFENNLKLDGIEMPMKLKNISKFETKNKHLNLRINVYSWETIDLLTQALVPILISKRKSQYTVNLLLYNNHFYYIKNFNRIMSSFGSTSRKFCYNCMSGFFNQKRLENHLENCKFFKPTKVIMAKDQYLSFKNVEFMHEFPYVMYCDFESVLMKTNQEISLKNISTHKHIPASYAFIIIKGESEVFYKSFYRGFDCMKVFLNDLNIQSMIISANLEEIVEMIPLTENEMIEHESTEYCYLCKEKFSDIDVDLKKVYDHCHLTGKYRGAAHQSCNLRYKMPKKIPLIFHNLKNYDSHFIIGSISNKNFINCDIIAQSLEKFIAFTLDSVQVLDSFQFLPASLSELVDNLRKSNYDFPITTKIFENKTNNLKERKELLMKKSFFPYEYIDDFSKYDEPTLPKRKCFYSSLSLNTISKEDYKFAKKIWEIFEFENLGEYSDFYNLLDTSLLADAFQKFRRVMKNTHSLEPCHFFSIPGLTFYAALKYTNVKLELIQDVDIYQMLEKGIRGGINGVMKRIAKANNEFTENYDSNIEKSYLIHLDGNNFKF